MPPKLGTQGGETKLKTEKSRDLRSKYRTLNDKLRSDGEDLADHTNDLLSKRVQELNVLSRDVERASEQAEDSEAFYMLTQKGAEMAKRVAAGKGRTANGFIRHLKAAYVEALDAQQEGAIDPAAFNWKHLSRRVRKYFKYAPGVSCLLGPLDALPKVKKQVQRIQRKPVGKAVAPQVLEREDAEQKEKRETERNMEATWKVVKDAPPEGLGFLEMVLNHRSFPQTAENIFSLSFLVNNKKVRLAKSDANNERGLLIFPYNEKAAQREGNNQADKDRQQFVMTYALTDWEKWKLHVREEDCLLPHRPEQASAHLAAGPSAAAVDERMTQDDEGADQERAPAPPKGRSKGGTKRVQKQLPVEEDEDEDEDEDQEEDQEEDSNAEMREFKEAAAPEQTTKRKRLKK